MRLAILLGLFLVACAPIIQEKQVYQLYLPMTAKPTDSRFSIQTSSLKHNVQDIENTLSLGYYGGYMFGQLDNHGLYAVMPKETWDQEIAWGWILPPYAPCTWGYNAHAWVSATECQSFVLRNKGKVWYIGNEPELRIGIVAHTPTEQAIWWHEVYANLRQLDATAIIIPGAWIYADPFQTGTPCALWMDKDGGFIDAYYQRWGQVPSDGWAFHYYQATQPYLPDSHVWIDCFINQLENEKARGRIKSSDVYITEFGWSPSAGTERDVTDFMQYWIGYLKTRNQVKRWYWWEWDSKAFLLDSSGNPTIVGLCYKNLASGKACQ